MWIRTIDCNPLQDSTLPKVSPALQGVMGLNMQYFVIYTLLAIDQTGNQFTNNAHLGMHNILETACTTVTYAAMLNVFFLAALTHAIKITQDKAKKYKIPQLWTRISMFSCVNAVPAQVIIVLVIPVLKYELEVSTDEHENLDVSHVASGRIVAMILSAAHFDIMLMLYDGFITVIGAVFMMQGPQEMWGERMAGCHLR